MLKILKKQGVKLSKEEEKQLKESMSKTKKHGTNKKKEPVMTDEECPNCGSPIVIKQGRWGEFKACSNYPKCKTIIK